MDLVWSVVSRIGLNNKFNHFHTFVMEFKAKNTQYKVINSMKLNNLTSRPDCPFLVSRNKTKMINIHHKFHVKIKSSNFINYFIRSTKLRTERKSLFIIGAHYGWNAVHTGVSHTIQHCSLDWSVATIVLLVKLMQFEAIGISFHTKTSSLLVTTTLTPHCCCFSIPHLFSVYLHAWLSTLYSISVISPIPLALACFIQCSLLHQCSTYFPFSRSHVSFIPVLWSSFSVKGDHARIVFKQITCVCVRERALVCDCDTQCINLLNTKMRWVF